MNLMQESRVRINEIDDQLVKLFEERMHVVENVAKYKAENNMPVFAASREKDNIEKNSAKLVDQNLKPYFVKWYQNTMDFSKEYQKDMLKHD
ncbi:MAG: chorismate mutase [Erysipelotrichaceae bacterium]|nr:chorismate mutase [Erysipelotrichaceae bacterium]